jgi:hypothetical protein
MLSVLCIILLPAFSAAESLAIPEESKAFANTMHFVSTLARNYDIELEVYGASHLTKATCQNFVSQLKTFRETHKNGFNELIRVREALDPLHDQALYRQWKRVTDEVLQDWDQVQKTFQHIQFQLNLHQTTDKKPPKNLKVR